MAEAEAERRHRAYFKELVATRKHPRLEAGVAVEDAFPFHVAVWDDDSAALHKLIQDHAHDVSPPHTTVGNPIPFRRSRARRW